MPMDDYLHHHGETRVRLEPENVSQLRLALTGNNDLKARLLSDELFLAWFAKQLTDTSDKLTGSDWPQLDILTNLQELIIVLRILVTFAGLRLQRNGIDIENLRFGAPVISKTIQYVLEVVLPRESCSNSDHLQELEDTIESIVKDSFHVFLVFANALKSSEDVNFAAIWKLLTSFMVLADSNSGHNERMLESGLQMVPFCLERGPKDHTIVYAKGMLAISLARLQTRLTRGVIADLENTDKNLENSKGEAPKNHQASFISLTSLVLAIVQMLNFLKEQKKEPLPMEHGFFESPVIQRQIFALLKYEGCKLLNVAALNMVRYNLTYLNQSLENVSSVFEKLLPRIIQLLEFEQSTSQPTPKYIELPVTILSDLCLKTPEICVHLRNTNVDLKIMLELERLFGQVTLFRQLHSLKATATGKLADFTVLRSSVFPLDSDVHSILRLAQESQLEVISNYLLLLSVFTSSNEEFRRRVTSYKNEQTKQGPNFLCLMVFEIVDSFRFIVEQTILAFRTFAQIQQLSDERVLLWYGSNIGVLYTLLENSVFSNTFYLIRSLSRSVSTLRTFFVDCNSIKSTFDPEAQTEVPKNDHSDSIVDKVAAGYDRELSFERKGSFITSLLEILSQLEDVQVVVSYFLSMRPDGPSQRDSSRKSICVKKVILLASIANFILDFSSFRYGIIHHESFLRDLAVLYMKALKSKEAYDLSEKRLLEDREVVYEQLRIQLGVFQVVKNYLYNENEESRKFVWDYIPLSVVFDKALYGIISEPESDLELHKLLLLHKTIAFEIMRNLTAASAYFSEAIKDSYLEYVKERHDEGQLHVPDSWNDFLYENLVSFDLFVDLTEDREENEKKFFSNDEFVLNLIKDENYVRLVVGINYLEDHRYTNISVFRKSDFPKSNLLDVWKRFLEVKLLDRIEAKICGLSIDEKVRLANLVSEVKVSVDWILINITWEDDTYGFQMPDNVNFRLLDTVTSSQEGHTSGSSGSNLFAPSNIVIEESEDEDEESHTGSADLLEMSNKDENGVLKPQARAKILNKHGFSNVLQRLIYDMSTPKYEPSRNRKTSLERFDSINANDLYEKLKTAHSQIISLLSGNLQGKHRALFSKQKHPLRRSSNIISDRDSERIRREVGSESTNDHVLWEERPPEFERDPEASDENGEEEIEEFWIR